MAWFEPDFLQFFNELKENQDRDWFKANKKRFESKVNKPFKKLVEELIARVNEDDPEVRLEAKDAIFRIYRDVRFSNDKRPYKDHVSAVISRGGRKDMRVPGMYLQLGADDLRVYGGLYGPDKEQLEQVRTYIASNPKEFRAAIEDKNFVKHFGEIHGEKNKRLSSEFVEAAEKEPLIFNKQFYYFVKLPADSVLREDLPELIMEHYHAGALVRNFLRTASGF